MVDKKTSLIPGIIFIAVGAWLFLHRFYHLRYYWEKIYPILICITGLLFLIEVYRRKSIRALFWGIFLLSIGCFFIIRNFEIIPYTYPDEYWPVFILALGFGSLAKFIFNPRNWSALLQALLSLFFGFVFLENFYPWISWKWRLDYEMFEYWPILIILLGLGILIRHFINPKKDK